MSEAQHEIKTAEARVEKNFRRMNFITLQGASEATFALADGRKKTFIIQGDHARVLCPGDEGELTWQGNAFLSFERPDGSMVTALFVIPAPEGGGNHQE